MLDIIDNPPHLHHQFPPRLVVGISAASGAILGIRLLEVLKSTNIETHLVLSESAPLTIQQETDWRLEDVVSLATVSYDFHEIGATIASGSFATLGMVIIPCSIKTLSAVANSYSDDLLSRAADVTLKEGRPLVLVVRETPYHPGHLRLMSDAALSGAVIFPPVPAFYIRPHSVDDIINNTVGRVLARLGIHTSLFHEWQGQLVE
jgi:4-hydroxy-3-polyprenylbenzoate decarboxylase